MPDDTCNHPGSVLIEEYPDGVLLWQCTHCPTQWTEDPAN